MKSCGLIVEYNPFHNGHYYHIQQAKRITNADCIIAVMSGTFLQRGEPAIIDKFHRTKAALHSGVDIVIELPFVYAVQNSDLFAKGAIQTLYHLGISSICFGSEKGNIDDFQTAYGIWKSNKASFQHTLQSTLKKGVSFPEAGKNAYKTIELHEHILDLLKPNNILGFSYVKEILDNKLPIDLYTIKRKAANYHDKEFRGSIASATSIRKALLQEGRLTENISNTLPTITVSMLKKYKQHTSIWHEWETYFPLLHYRVMCMTTKELQEIHGVEEGLEYRIKQTAKKATSFRQWMQNIKTKRYTWTRLQRVFVHILCNTKKEDVFFLQENQSIPYARILGMTNTGQTYLNKYKKQIEIPLITKISKKMHPFLHMEERVSSIYYSVLPPSNKVQFIKSDLQPPIMVKS